MDQIISPGADWKNKVEEEDEDNFDWSDIKNNPTARGKSSICYLPKWQKHDARTYGFLNPRQEEHRRAVCAECLSIIGKEDCYDKAKEYSDKCLRCIGIRQLEKTSVHAGPDVGWSRGMHISLMNDYEEAFCMIVDVFNLLNPKESELVRAMPSKDQGDILDVLRVIWRTIGSRKGIRKMLSHFGAIRVRQDDAMKEIENGNIMRYFVDMQQHVSSDGGITTWRFRLNYDAGNVALTKWLRHVIGEDLVRAYTTSPNPSAEACGDMVEAAVGVFDVLSAFVHIQCVRPLLPINNVRSGIEASILQHAVANYNDDSVANAKGRTTGTISEDERQSALKLREELEFPVMNPCLKGSSEFVYDQIEIIEVDDDESDVNMDDKEDDPDYDPSDQGEDMEVPMDEDDDRSKINENRQSCLEGLEILMNRLASSQPCHRCGSSEHCALDCPVGKPLDEVTVTLREAIEERPPKKRGEVGGGGSAGDSLPKRQRRTDRKSGGDGEDDSHDGNGRGEQLPDATFDDEAIMTERQTWVTDVVRMTELDINIYFPERRPNRVEIADAYDKHFSSLWILTKMVENELEEFPGSHMTSSEKLSKEAAEWNADPHPLRNQLEGPISPRFPYNAGHYTLELYNAERDSLFMFHLMEGYPVEVGYRLYLHSGGSMDTLDIQAIMEPTSNGAGLIT